jgi:hypothetical protein
METAMVTERGGEEGWEGARDTAQDTWPSAKGREALHSMKGSVPVECTWKQRITPVGGSPGAWG